MDVIALAIEAAGAANGQAIRDAMVGVSTGGTKYGPEDYAAAVAAIHANEDVDYQGASGEIDFDGNGDVEAPFDIWDVEDGQITITQQGVSPD